jgi:hypothetical protein
MFQYILRYFIDFVALQTIVYIRNGAPMQQDAEIKYSDELLFDLGRSKFFFSCLALPDHF